MAGLVGGFGIVGRHSGTRSITVRIETSRGAALAVMGSRFPAREEVLEGGFERIRGIGVSRREHSQGSLRVGRHGRKVWPIQFISTPLHAAALSYCRRRVRGSDGQLMPVNKSFGNSLRVEAVNTAQLVHLHLGRRCLVVPSP